MNHLTCRRNYKFSLFLIFALTWGVPTLGFTDHFKITARATRGIPLAEVAYESLDQSLARGLGFTAKNSDELKTYLKINKQYDFPRKLGEKEGGKLLVEQILSIYSDEPDWGADRELFEADQYPELWQADTKYIAARHGTPSQGFRHMYFPGEFSLRHPIASFQIPMHPVGEAPSRADLFYRLSQACFKNHSPYWGYRFLAWSLHYVEDLFQPFHVSQTPSKRFIEWKWSYGFPTIDMENTLSQITYYHFSYEWWVSSRMTVPSSPLMKKLETNIKVSPLTLAPSYTNFVLSNVVAFSAGRASELGKVCYQLFPAYQPKSGKTPSEIVGSPPWEAAVQDSGANGTLEQISFELFTQMGQAIRAIVISVSSKS